MFWCEGDLVRWCRDIPQDPDNIFSYVQSVELKKIHGWSDPTILGRVLGCLSRVKIFRTFNAAPPRDGLPSIASSGAFGREITSLAFGAPSVTVPTLMLLVSPSPNSRESLIEHHPSWPKPPMSLAPEHI